MTIAALVLLAMLTGFTGRTHAVRSGGVPLGLIQGSNTSSSQLGQINGNQIKITIATGGGLYQAAKDIFRVGESVPLVITLTNTGSEPVYVCRSGSLYQNRPQLLREGQSVPYTSLRQSTVQATERNKTCQEINLPEEILLRPNEPTVVDWFNLAEGANSLYRDGWFESLPAGKYTLTNQRRLSCCDGPLIESNPIEFAVVP